MSTWTKQKLGDVIEVYNGKAVEVKSLGTFPVYGSNGKIGYTSEANYCNAIVLGRVGAYCGSVMIERGDFWASDNTIVVKNNNNADLGFLYYLLKNLNLNQYAGGTAQPLITHTLLRQINVSVPKTPAQIRIASVLSVYDNLIENNEKRIKALEEMVQLFYIEWFVKFKFPGHAKVKIVENKFGKTPELWETKRLDEVANIRGGKYLPREQIKKVGPFPVFGGNGVQGYSEKSTHDGFVIAFGRVGAYCGSIHWSYNGAWLNNNSSSIVPKQYNELVLEHLRKYNFTNLRGGAAQPFISNDVLGGVLIAMPTPDVANHYCNIMRSIRVQQVALENMNISLRQIRDLLIPQLVTGKRELK